MLFGGKKTSMPSVIARADGRGVAYTHENTIGIVFLLGNSCEKANLQTNESPICRGLRMGLGTGPCFGVTDCAHRRSTVSSDNSLHRSRSFFDVLFSGKNFMIDNSGWEVSGASIKPGPYCSDRPTARELIWGTDTC